MTSHGSWWGGGGVVHRDDITWQLMGAGGVTQG